MRTRIRMQSDPYFDRSPRVVYEPLPSGVSQGIAPELHLLPLQRNGRSYAGSYELDLRDLQQSKAGGDARASMFEGRGVVRVHTSAV